MMSAAPQGYYAASSGPYASRPRLCEPTDADICIIGAGYTGLAAALTAAEAGARVILLESNRIGFGASGRNGGQIHTGLRKTQEELERWLGVQHARDIWALSEQAKTLTRSLAADCELKPGLIIAAHDAAAARELARECDHLARAYGYTSMRMLDREEAAAHLGTEAYFGARFDSGGGHLHPLRFAQAIAAAAEKSGARLYEDSAAVSFEQGRRVRIATAQGTVAADWLLLATDAFSGSIAPALDRYIGHVESFVTATAPLPPSLAGQIIPCDAAVADTRHVLDYYRKSADGRLLFAGREAYFRKPSDVAGLVRPRMLKVFPQLADVPTEYAWSGTVGITVTRMPHFGRLSDRVLFAHGYSGQGVALATLGGQLMAETAMGKPEHFDVFARVPARPFPGGRVLRKPLVAAGLLAFKLLDAI